MREGPSVCDRRTAAALALAFVAGFVDVMGWLALDRLYTSHMTGNTAAIGHELANGHAGQAFTRAVPVLGFLAGLAAGAVLAEVQIRRNARVLIAPGLVLVAALVGGFLLWAQTTVHVGVVPLEPAWAFDLQAALLSAAMGVQTATFRRVDGAVVRTTYVTGMLTHFVEELVERLAAPRDAPDASFARRLVIVGGIWPGFLAGAVAGALGHARWGVNALVAPLALLLALAGLDLARPMGGPAGPKEERRAQRRGGRD